MNVLIIGQGLAGSALAWRLLHRGASCLVVDRPLNETASRVAAGLVNPLTGRKVRPEWRQSECLSEADAYYRETEEELGGAWWQRIPIWRELETPDLEEMWRERQIAPDSSAFAGPILPWPHGWQGRGHAAYTRGGAVLHAEVLVNAQRRWLTEQGAFEEGEVAPSDIVRQDAEFVWRGKKYDRVVWCIGYETAKTLNLPALESRLSKGTIADISLPDFEWDAGVLHFGHWLVKHGSVWRLGATYEWAWESPNEADTLAVHELLTDLACRYRGRVEVIRARSAVRPIIRYSQPVAGALPDCPGQYIFSGLGSRGVTTSPWVSRLLADHLLDGTPLPEDVTPDPLFARWAKRHA